MTEAITNVAISREQRTNNRTNNSKLQHDYRLLL